jgi:hypothetical protein
MKAVEDAFDSIGRIPEIIKFNDKTEKTIFDSALDFEKDNEYVNNQNVDDNLMLPEELNDRLVKHIEDKNRELKGIKKEISPKKSKKEKDPQIDKIRITVPIFIFNNIETS